MALAFVGATLLAAPVSAKTIHTRHVRPLAADGSRTYRHDGPRSFRRVYRPTFSGPIDLSTSKHFDDQFILDP
jgi:hypothetical protein